MNLTRKKCYECVALFWSQGDRNAMTVIAMEESFVLG